MRWQSVQPSEAAAAIVRILAPDAESASGDARTFPLTSFQEAAVARARALLGRRGGVIVADDVGLGKTYVALALLEEEIERAGEVVLVIPSVLRGTWLPLVKRLERSTGGADRVRVFSHAAMSRGVHDAQRLAAAGLVVVDEAHAFRSPGTRRYRALAEGVRGGRLVLITATPVNNGLPDLYHLIRLFADDDAFHDLGVASLRSALLEGVEAAGPGEEARRVVREVVVRRTRAEVGGAMADPAGPSSFPAREPTVILRYEDARLDDLVRGIEGLELEAYGTGTDALIRLGLLKRLESGAPALRTSLLHLAGFLRRRAEAADRGRLLVPGSPSSVSGGGDDATQLVMEELVLECAPPGADLPGVAASARGDAIRVRALLRRLDAADPKLGALEAWLRSRPAGEKVVIFTEFRDTAAALWRALVGRGGVGRVDGEGAWLGLRRSGRRAVVERFAPVSSGAGPPGPRERVDILVATDVLSEGLNLQDARVVVCYDLPWNPVRLFQRIGRVDRLGSLHETVQPVLFVPGGGLERMLGVIRVLRAKLGGIDATVGGSEAAELLTLLGHGDKADPLDRLRTAVADPWERLRCAVRHLPDNVAIRHPDADSPLLAAHQEGDGLAWLVLVQAGARSELVRIGPDGKAGRPDTASLHALEAALTRAARPAGDASRDELLRVAEEIAETATAYVRLSRAAEHAAPPAVGPRCAEARLTAEVTRRVRALGPEPHPELLRRADEVLRALARPLDAGGRVALERVAAAAVPDGGHAGAGLEELLDAIRCVLPSASGGLRERVLSAPGSPVVLVALRVPVGERKAALAAVDAG